MHRPNYAVQPRKGAGSIFPPQHPHQQQAQLQNAQAMSAQSRMGIEQQQRERREEAFKARASRPTDRNIPDELSEVVVGDGVERYDKLRAVEKRLDATMMRKRFDINDNMSRRPTRREGVLRIWVSNTAEGQPWQVVEEGMALGEDGTLDFGDSSGATFRMKIEGRLLDDDDKSWAEAGDKEKKAAQETAGGDDPEKSDRPQTPRRPRLSHFFKSITVDFDRNHGSTHGYSAIEWQKPPLGPGVDANSSEVSFDRLEFERRGDSNINVTISLLRDEKNERYRLSPQLADILDIEEDDRAGVIHGVWEYCRVMGLQEDEDRRSIVCDEPLRRLFQKDKIYFPYVPDLIHPHLQPLPPVQLNYTIRVDKAYIDGSDSTPPSEPTIYDIRVPIPNPLFPALSHFLHTHQSNPSHIKTLQQITSLDSDLALLVQKIHQTNAKRKFYENLAKDPVGFVKRWTSSQRRDLEVILAEERNAGTEGSLWADEWRRGGNAGIWGTQQAQESVGLFLARSSKTY